MEYIMRPPASARESIRRLLVMNCCMRAWERWGWPGTISSEEGWLWVRPPHSGRKTGSEVMR